MIRTSSFTPQNIGLICWLERRSSRFELNNNGGEGVKKVLERAREEDPLL
jgi:hypothetical protein